MVDYLTDICGMCTEENVLPVDGGPSQPPIAVVIAPDLFQQSGHRVRGWLQHEVEAGMREESIPQHVDA